MRKAENARLFDLFAGDGAAFFAAGDDTAGAVSVLFAVDPLKQDIQQKVTAKNAKRQKHGKRHRDLNRAAVNG